MNCTRAVIIDDEINNCENLKELIHQYCKEIEIVGQANSAVDGFSLIKQCSPQLVFLDIQMPGGTGFDLLERLQPTSFEVIFVTAYDQYAIKAIRLCAIDYLLKPINILDLKAAVHRAIIAISNKKPSQGISKMLDNAQNGFENLTIALPTSERVIYVKVSEIIRCLGDNNYTTVYLNSGESILVSKTLKEYEELLAESSFLRVHQSHLINFKYVRSYEKQDGGYLKMTDGSSISISRQRKQSVLNKLNSPFTEK
jgi:two-component system LytT family response regulator